MTLLALRIGNDVSYETRINHEIHFAWQAQYLVNLDCHFSWQAAFGEVSKMGRVMSPKWRVRDDDFMLGSWSD